ncbi:MAG: hypothetical protein NC040_01660 [Muribaculaceae bacterium]|nr:hypothetical protein [Alistipes senegalensis]MCM1472735.1 hypothetical protein [Muribaculaceae bacterium]
MWIEINSEKDIEDFLKKTEILDDWDDIEIISMKYENHNISLIVECRTFGRLEMFFESVHHFSNFRLSRSYCVPCKKCYLEFRTDLLGKTRNDRLVVWTDNYRVLNSDSLFEFDSDNSVIVAYSMKYRFIGVIDDTETEQ